MYYVISAQTKQKDASFSVTDYGWTREPNATRPSRYIDDW